MPKPKSTVHTKAVQRYLSVQAVAEYLDLSRMSVYRAIDAGEIEAIRIGRSIRIHVDELRRLTGDNAINPGDLGMVDQLAARNEARRAGRVA